MSYDFISPCGCTVHVECNVDTRVAQSRIIAERSATCGNRRHRTGERFWVWELLPAGADFPSGAQLGALA
jgi:hypothetical protein